MKDIWGRYVIDLYFTYSNLLLRILVTCVKSSKELNSLIIINYTNTNFTQVTNVETRSGS